MAKFVINAWTHLTYGLSLFEAVYSYQLLFNIPVGQWIGYRDLDE